jgi:hypothetical protein
MILKVSKNTFTQECSCGTKHNHEYFDISINKDFVVLPECTSCGSFEILKNTINEDLHSLLVSRVFANIASLYSKDKKQKIKTKKPEQGGGQGQGN